LTLVFFQKVFMKKLDLIRAWGRVLGGHYPLLSVEITRECPLRCPGCYAYEPEHLGEAGPLRSLADHKGNALVEEFFQLVRAHRPIYISIVGGEPLVRYRELDIILPRLSKMGLGVQLVTSAVRPIPPAWSTLPDLSIVVSIDGLQPDHDPRRKPATYQRILENIAGHSITVHCTVTRAQTLRPGYFEEFLDFWSSRSEVKRIWFSLFTPQIGAHDPEIIPRSERPKVLNHLASLTALYPKLVLPKTVLQGYLNPPQSPSDCLFARANLSITADLKSRITPCQFGGDPDCSQCGCMASAGFKAVADTRLLGILPLKKIYDASDAIGRVSRAL
jgi:pyruvate-formate lyase-activating enzyme